MAMTRDPLLEVGESEVRGAHVPAFRVFSEEVVGVVVRRGMHEEWIRFFRDLLSDDGTSATPSHRRTAILDPFEIYGDSTDGLLPDILSSRGLTRSQITEIISTVGLQPDRIYGSLPFTDRVLIELHVLLQRGVNLALVATAGLDPLGIQRLIKEVLTVKRQCSSIVMFHADFVQFHEPLARFDRVIHVR